MSKKIKEENPAGAKLAKKALYGQVAVKHPRGMRQNGVTVGSKKDK